MDRLGANLGTYTIYVIVADFTIRCQPGLGKRSLSSVYERYKSQKKAIALPDRRSAIAFFNLRGDQIRSRWQEWIAILELYTCVFSLFAFIGNSPSNTSQGT